MPDLQNTHLVAVNYRSYASPSFEIATAHNITAISAIINFNILKLRNVLLSVTTTVGVSLFGGLLHNEFEVMRMYKRSHRHTLTPTLLTDAPTYALKHTHTQAYTYADMHTNILTYTHTRTHTNTHTQLTTIMRRRES